MLVVVGYFLPCSCGLCLTFSDNELGDVERFHVVILLHGCQPVLGYILTVDLMFLFDLLMAHSVCSSGHHKCGSAPAVEYFVLVLFVCWMRMAPPFHFVVGSSRPCYCGTSFCKGCKRLWPCKVLICAPAHHIYYTN